MLNYTAGGKTTAAIDSHKTGIFKKVQYCKSAPNKLAQLPDNTTQLCMQSVHQNTHHNVHTEGLIRTLPYGAMACRMVHLHACPCFFMYMRWGIWMTLRVTPHDSVSFFFFLLKSLWVTPEQSDLMDLPLSLPLASSFQTSLPPRPQTSTLVTLIHYTVGKYAFESLLWIHNDLIPLSFGPYNIKKSWLFGK